MSAKVYAAMRNVMEDVGKSGISKARKNAQQGYQFRGIDDVYNELNAILSKHNLLICPRMKDRFVTERTTNKGGVLFYVTVNAEFEIISSEDGSKHVISTFGEAMDSGDKATNKAMSAAYKYAAMMLFCIPTEGDNDADAETHEVSPIARESAAKMKEGLALIDDDLVDCDTVERVNACAKGWQAVAERDGWTKEYRQCAAEKFRARRNAIQNANEMSPENIFPGDVERHPIMAG